MKTSVTKQAQDFFEEGYNCCQSVFLVFGERYGFSRETSCRLAASFGGGVGRLRQICGAVSAMALVCGLETGAVEGADQAGKAYNYENVQKLAARFEAQAGSLICRELLGLDRQPVMEGGMAPDEPPRRVVEGGTAPDESLRAVMEGGMGRYQPQARDERYYATRPCKHLIGLAAGIIEEWLEEREAVQNGPGLEEREAAQNGPGLEERETAQDRPGLEERETVQNRPGQKGE